MLYKMLVVERTYDLCGQGISKPRQLFVTQSRVLAGKVEQYFLQLLGAWRPQGNLPGKKAILDGALVDIDDEMNWRNDLPRKYSELRDEHFPLFITFDRVSCALFEAFQSLEISYRDQLSSLLEADASPSQENDFLPRNVSAEPPAIETGEGGRSIRLTYEVFLAHYWPHLSQSLTKGLGICPL